MRYREKYGSYEELKCPFCERRATAKNKENIPVCSNHKNQKLPAMKCVCKKYVDLMNGKNGPFFSCVKCGIVSFDRIMEINTIEAAKPESVTVKAEEVDFLY